MMVEFSHKDSLVVVVVGVEAVFVTFTVDEVVVAINVELGDVDEIVLGILGCTVLVVDIGVGVAVIGGAVLLLAPPAGVGVGLTFVTPSASRLYLLWAHPKDKGSDRCWLNTTDENDLSDSEANSTWRYGTPAKTKQQIQN